MCGEGKTTATAPISVINALFKRITTKITPEKPLTDKELDALIKQLAVESVGLETNLDKWPDFIAFQIRKITDVYNKFNDRIPTSAMTKMQDAKNRNYKYILPTILFIISISSVIHELIAFSLMIYNYIFNKGEIELRWLENVISIYSFIYNNYNFTLIIVVLIAAIYDYLS